MDQEDLWIKYVSLAECFVIPTNKIFVQKVKNTTLIAKLMEADKFHTFEGFVIFLTDALTDNIIEYECTNGFGVRFYSLTPFAKDFFTPILL